ncbi:hypothetical protein ACSQ67_012875 [Phaseolus vulgaris]
MIDWVKSVAIKLTVCVLLHLRASQAKPPFPEATILSLPPWAPHLIHIIPVTSAYQDFQPHRPLISLHVSRADVTPPLFHVLPGECSFDNSRGYLSVRLCDNTSPNLKTMMPMTCLSSIVSPILLSRICQVKMDTTRALVWDNKLSTNAITVSPKRSFIHCLIKRSKFSPKGGGPMEKKKGKKTTGKKEHHLWKSRDSAQSGQKALTLVRIVSKLPNEKEAVYGALDKWIAWETEFPVIAAAKALNLLYLLNRVSKLPNEKEAVYGALDKWIAWETEFPVIAAAKALNLLYLLNRVSKLPNEKEAVYGALDKWIAWETEFPVIAAAKALKILRKRGHWVRVIQVAKWMLSKGQGATMGTFDTLLLAFDMDQRVDEAESLWNMIIHTHMRSVSKRLFSRMISIYDNHDMPDKIIEVFADMEELRVKPDEDTVRRVARAFTELGEEEKRKLVTRRYGIKWKYIHFNRERVRVRTEAYEDNESTN